MTRGDASERLVSHSQKGAHLLIEARYAPLNPDLAAGMLPCLAWDGDRVLVAHLRYDDDVHHFDRITMDPEVMGGKPCIRGMRVTVGMIVEAMAAGRTIEELLTDFPYIEEPDIREALAFAARLAQGHEIRLAS
jgi:uncharacterized protein (DUF433 family)